MIVKAAVDELAHGVTGASRDRIDRRARGRGQRATIYRHWLHKLALIADATATQRNVAARSSTLIARGIPAGDLVSSHRDRAEGRPTRR